LNKGTLKDFKGLAFDIYSTGSTPQIALHNVLEN